MYTNILHATDLNETHFNICEKAVQIAQQFNAKLYLLHVIDVPAGIQLAQSLGFTELAAPSTQDAWTVMNLLGEAVNIPVERQFVEVGSASEIITEKVKTLACDLLLLGNHASESFPSLIGSTTSHLFLHAPCDVMTLRSL